MPNYIVNSQAQSNGDHEVHAFDCNFLPALQHRIALGFHSNCSSAVTKAKSIGYQRANGCYFCAYSCHTG